MVKEKPKISEIKEIIEELKNIHDGNAWHGASLTDALEGIACEQAAAHPLKNAHGIWEIVAHIKGWEDVFRRRLEGEIISEPEAGEFLVCCCLFTMNASGSGIAEGVDFQHCRSIELEKLNHFRPSSSFSSDPLLPITCQRFVVFLFAGS